MEGVIVGLPILLLLILIGIGVPIAYSLFISGILGLYFFAGPEMTISMLTTTARSETAVYLFTTIPMFLLMAEFLSKSGILASLFKAVDRISAHLPGGLAIATTIANGGMAALSGSSTASAATMAKVAIPEMRKYDYDDRLSMGTVAGAGTFAILIPPSIGLIIYGIMTETSITRLFMAGIIPGILTLGSYILLIMLWVKYNPEMAGGVKSPYTWGERFEALLPTWPAFLLVAIVLGGLYSGVVTPTEAGALGAFGALVIGIIVYDLDFTGINESLTDCIEVTSMIFMILIGAGFFGFYLSATRIPRLLISYVAELPFGRWPIFLIIIFMYLLLGMIMNQSAILILTLPVTFPLIVNGLDFNAIWFGIIIAKTAEIGMITPPLGLNVYVASAATDIEPSVGFRGALPFILTDLVVLAILMIFPLLILYLPGTM